MNTNPYPQLPFPRGTTYSQGVAQVVGKFAPSSSLDSDHGAHLVGSVWSVYDAATDSVLRLRVVRNSSESALTLSNKFVAFSKLGCNVSGYVSSAGAPTKPVDAAYNGKSCPANDLFYVVDEGIVTVQKTTGAGTAISAGDVVRSDANAKANGSTSSGAVAGRAIAAAADAADSVQIYVNPGFGDA